VFSAQSTQIRNCAGTVIKMHETSANMFNVSTHVAERHKRYIVAPIEKSASESRGVV
jgi:hypothetical protein